jgi:hypothetical protein
MLRLANMSNGLAYPHDMVAYFQSQYAHHMKLNYFNRDAMPWDAVIHLLKGGEICVIDASQHHRLTDALKYGVPTWCAVFNRAVYQQANVCSWFTPEMRKVSTSKHVKPIVNSIRKLVGLIGSSGPLIISQNVHLICHMGVKFDDKPEMIRRLNEAIRTKT